MTWKCYELKFKAISGIHIGYRKLGMINQTRYYIPGKTMWGAVTAILSRRFMENYGDKKIYDEFKEFVKKHLIFSYFYPIRGEDILYPTYEEGLKFRNMSKEDFENKFISSYVSTAVNPNSRTAEEGSLHEFEYISSKIRKNDNVHFIGYLFFNEGGNRSIFIKELNDEIIIEKSGKEVQLFKEIERIQVGGERNYGFGWLDLVNHQPKSDKVNLYDSNSSAKVNLKENLTLENTGNNESITALSHVNIENLNFESIQGDIEPFLGREWGNEKDKKGAGQKISDPIICLTPGTKFRLKENTKLTINDYGIWQLKT